MSMSVTRPEPTRQLMNSSRAEKTATVHRVSLWKGVLRDYLLRRRWVQPFLGNKRKRRLLRSLYSDPHSRRTPCGQGQLSLS